jgi:hypothetical protein
MNLSLCDQAAKKYAKQFGQGRPYDSIPAYARQDFKAGWDAALAQQAQPPTDDEMRAVWAVRFVRILDDTENVKDAQMHRAYLLADAVLALLDAPKPGTRMNLEQLSRAEGCSECGYNIPPNGVHASWCGQKPKQR